METEQLTQLRAALLAAFANVPPPRPDRADLYSREDLNSAGKQRLGDDATTEWTQIPNQWINAFCRELALVSAETFRYYLPALLLYSIDHWKNSEVWDWTLITITPNDNSKRYRVSLIEYHRARFGSFTPAQMQVIFDFLDLVLEDTQDWISWTAADEGKKYLMELLGEIQQTN
jgi:hypothetical protein